MEREKMTLTASGNQTLVIPAKAVLTKLVIPAKAGIQFLLGFTFQAELSARDAERKLLLDGRDEEKNWIPAFAGMTSHGAKPKHCSERVRSDNPQSLDSRLRENDER
jgi:hypothetical protein